MKLFTFCVLLAHLPMYAIGQQKGADLIAASIAFHDPENRWPTIQSTFHFSDSRPGKETRSADLYLNNAEGILCIMRKEDNKEVTRHIINNKCTYDIQGNFNLSPAEIEDFNLTEERSLMLRNYYLYLWGLPMKLTDDGTIIDPEVYRKEFNNQSTNAIKVTYDAEVGADTWYFYFDQKTNEMVGYQFFHDEEKGDGEYIILSGIVEVNGMKIPKRRTWYTNSDSTLLGTDRLISITPLTHKH